MILSFYENVCEKNLINKAIVGLRIDTDPMTKRTLQIIKFLEFRRFVVSTEIGQKQIGVKVRGVHRFNGDEGNLFYICANREEHKKAPTNRG